MRIAVIPTSIIEIQDVQVSADKTLSGKLQFYGDGKDCVAAFTVKVLNETGVVRSVHVLRVSGKTGKPTLHDATPVLPAIEQEEAVSAAETAKA